MSVEVGTDARRRVRTQREGGGEGARGSMGWRAGTVATSLLYLEVRDTHKAHEPLLHGQQQLQAAVVYATIPLLPNTA